MKDLTWVRSAVLDFLADLRAIRVALERQQAVRCESCAAYVADTRYCSNCGMRRT